MKVWVKVSIILIMLAVLIAISVGILMGMSKSYEVRIDYGDEVKSYVLRESMASAIMRKIKYGGSMLREFESMSASSQNDYDSVLLAMNGEFEGIVRDIKSHAREKVESEIIFDKSKSDPFTYKVGTAGQKVNIDGYKTILSAIDKGDMASDIYDIDAPKTIEDMKKCTMLLGEYTTLYETSTPSRRENIRVASDYLNGSIIDTGKILSFNEIVGERTKERGFKEAKVIINGEYVEGYGGGVCQVSTTLYNAWVLSGLKVEYAKNHSLPPHYVELSRDAMVSSYNDLLLVNNSKYPIYVCSILGKDSITFKIYGMENDRSYSIESETIEVLPIGDKVLGEVGEDEEYDEIIISNGVNGYKSRAYLVEYEKNGAIVGKKLLREDEYKSQPRIIERVRKTA